MEYSSYKAGFKRKMHYRIKKAKTEDELHLEKLVFGQVENVFGKDESQDEERNSTDENDSDLDEISPAKSSTKKLKPLWVDEDDNQIVQQTGETKKQYLENKFKKIHGTPSWAKLDPESDEDNESTEFIRTVSNNVKKTKHLPSNSIEVFVCNNLANKSLRLGPIVNIEFHPQLHLALIAGKHEQVVLSRVDGSSDNVVQTVNFDQYELTSANFTKDGTKLVVSSAKRKHLLVHDLVAGKTNTFHLHSDLSNREIRFLRVSPDGNYFVAVCCNGYLQLISAKTCEWLQTLKMNHKINDVQFDVTGETMYCITEGGMIYVWDMTTRSCINQVVDEGRVSGGIAAISPDQSLFAVGSISGVVNVYDAPSLNFEKEPRPQKSIFNLTTQISSLKFNSTSEVLAFSSKRKMNSLRLAHTSTFTTFTNFPLPWYELHCISVLEFSPSSGYLAVGTEKGVVNLYRLMHYENY